jgi:hypothetical protein
MRKKLLEKNICLLTLSKQFEQARNAATMRFRFSSTLAVALSELNCGSALACAQAFANE